VTIEKKLFPLGAIDILFNKLGEVGFVGDIEDLNSSIKILTSFLGLLIAIVELIGL